MFQKNNNKRIYLYILVLIVSINSCIGYKKTLFFQGDQQSLSPISVNETYKLRKGDVVKIKISSPGPENLEMLNMEENANVLSADAYFTGHYINDSGYVDLPLIGKVFIEGHTIMAVDSLITLKVKDQLNFYTVDVKLGSFKIVALGEFKRPGLFYVPYETCTIYEAIGIAGDATDYANKEKIQLIRTLDDGSKKIYHLNLTDYSGFTQDNYYLQPHDIIYIQPQKAKVDKQNITYVSLGIAAFSLILLLLKSY